MKVLIVDDHKMFIEGIQHVLAKEFGHDSIGSVINGKEAIERCHQEKFDIVLMDINMPILDGTYACKEIKRHSPDTKIIFVTMLCNYSNAFAAFQAGADGFVFKGDSSEEIIQAIKESKANKKFITESLRHFFTEDFLTKKHMSNVPISFSENIISQREKEVLKLISEGHTNDQISQVLSISVRTVDTHRNNMLTKLKLPNTASLVAFALKNNLIDF